MLAKMTSFAQPKPRWAAVAAAIAEQNVAHAVNGVHVDARPARRHVDRGADPVGLREHVGQRFHDHRVAGRDALVHQGREAADEIDAAIGRRGIERFGHLHGRPVAVPGQQRRGGRDGQPLVDHRNAVLGPHAVAHLDQPARPRDDLVPQLPAQVVEIRRRAVVEVQAQRYAAHVEVLGVQHVDGREDFVSAKHGNGKDQVDLSAVKDLARKSSEILRCAQNDCCIIRCSE